MKARMHFDTLTYANKLKAAGMDPKLAEVQALALVDAMDDGVATKADIIDLKNELHIEMNKNDAKFAMYKFELIQWMIGLFITNVTLVGAFIAFAQFLGHSQ